MCTVISFVFGSMDAVNHMSVYRKDLRQFVQANKLENVAIPEDGETVKF